MPWGRGGTKSTNSAPKGFSPKARYLFDLKTELVWDTDSVSDGHQSHGEGWCACCAVLEFMCTPCVIYLVQLLLQLCGIWPETPSVFHWGRRSIKTWRIGFLLSPTVIHVPVCESVCCLILTLTSVCTACPHTTREAVQILNELKCLKKQKLHLNTNIQNITQ